MLALCPGDFIQALNAFSAVECPAIFSPADL